MSLTLGIILIILGIVGLYFYEDMPYMLFSSTRKIRLFRKFVFYFSLSCLLVGSLMSLYYMIERLSGI